MAIYRAKEAFALPGPTGRVVTPGSLMSDDDPAFKGKEHLFELVEDHVRKDTARVRGNNVEDASAEPNTRRSVSTVSTKSAAKGVSK